MKKEVRWVLLPAICGMLLTSCATTGDPTAGGIFWSPTKAQARQQALIQEGYTKQAELNSEAARSKSLLAQRERLIAQINAKKAQIQRASSPEEVSSINREIADLQRQLASL